MGRFRGNTIAEYIFIGGLLLLVCITAVVAIGKGLNTKLLGLKGSMMGNINAAQTASAAAAAAQAVGGNVTAGAKGVKAKAQCYTPTICIIVPDVIAGNGKVAVTAGANGGKLTKAYSNVLKQLLLQLEKDPNADQTLLKMIKQLANGGFSLSKAEYDSLQWCNKKVCAKGSSNSTTIQNQADKGLQKTDNVFFAYDDYSTLADQVKAYMSAHPGSLPPELQGLVNNASGNIVTIAKAFNPVDNFGSTTSGNTTTVGQDVKSTTALKDAPASTTQNANNQCSVATAVGCQQQAAPSGSTPAGG